MAAPKQRSHCRGYGGPRPSGWKRYWDPLRKMEEGCARLYQSPITQRRFVTRLWDELKNLRYLWPRLAGWLLVIYLLVMLHSAAPGNKMIFWQVVI